jgi:hypothetical protein
LLYEGSLTLVEVIKHLVHEGGIALVLRFGRLGRLLEREVALLQVFEGLESVLRELSSAFTADGCEGSIRTEQAFCKVFP